MKSSEIMVKDRISILKYQRIPLVHLKTAQSLIGENEVKEKEDLIAYKKVAHVYSEEPKFIRHFSNFFIYY
jgi:hypothetical protein